MPGFPVSSGGNGPNGMTSLNSNLSGTGSQLVTLVQPSQSILIQNYSPFNLYLNFAGPAHQNNFFVPANNSFQYAGPAITSFQLSSNGNSINYGVFAF